MRNPFFCFKCLEYFAPEVLVSEEHSMAADWWSFGTLMFEMITGLPPFYSQDVQVMCQKIISEKLKIPETMSSEAALLLSGLLEKDPAFVDFHLFFLFF